MSQRNRFLILLGIIFGGSFIYYLATTDRTHSLELIGTVDANQVIVSPQIQGRIEKLLVDEGTPVKAGDVIALLDASELQAQEQAASATINSLRSKVAETLATELATRGSTSSDVANAEARLESTRAQLAQAEANLEQIKTDHDRTVALATSGVASQQDKDRADAQLKAQQAAAQALRDQVRAAQADLNSAIARTHQATAAQRTVAATRADMANAAALQAEAQVRLGYTRVLAPVSGTVSVRAAREGEVVSPGQPIVTIVDLSDTWVRAAVPETYADRIALGDVFNIRMPSGQVVPGKVFFKAVEGDFATQRDVSRRKRDIKTVVLKLRVENPNELFVPGMTADVLVPQAVLQAGWQQRKQEAAKPAQPQAKPTAAVE
ncbi:MAG TPA: efflux RND transporter periplasmic adaptor subunit [Terriglobales bacterium]|nr:efflux RND transporter periplasmic adaptor subunit [Terriglobales bacterium]